MMSWLTWWKLQSWSWARMTCAYQHVFHPKAPKEMIQVLQFFVMPGLGQAAVFYSSTMLANDFYYAFSHYTSCCVVVQDG
jgi:hypothetical protein